MRPRVGSTRRLTQRSKVLLPEPLKPMSTTNPTPTPTPTPVPSSGVLGVLPVQAAPGDKVTITGSRFFANEAVVVYLDTNDKPLLDPARAAQLRPAHHRGELLAEEGLLLDERRLAAHQVHPHPALLVDLSGDRLHKQLHRGACAGCLLSPQG